MKKYLLLPIVILLLLSLFQACTDQDQAIEPIEQKAIIEQILLEENTHLQNLVHHISNSSLKSGRTNSVLDQVDFSKATKLYDSDNQVTKYTFSMTEQDDVSLRNFILIEPDLGKISGLVFTHTADQDWLSAFDSLSNWDKFTGQFTISDLEDNIINQSQIVDGISTHEKSTNGRTTSQTCVTRYILRTKDWYVNGRYVDTQTWIETQTNCYSSGGGGASGTPTLGDGGSEPLPQRDVLTLDDNFDGGVAPSPTSCRDGYVRDGSGNCIATVVVISPETPIADMVKYLECFDTSKSATIAIYADQPKSGSSDAWAATWSGAVVGHTFVSIIQEANTSVFGFYPSTDDTRVTSPPELSAMGNDSGESYNVSVSITVSGNVLQQILQYAISYNDTYDLDNYNCTDFGIEIGNLAGMGLPDCYGSWLGGGGSNPGTLGQHLRNMTLPNGAIRNTSGGTAPTNKKGC